MTQEQLLIGLGVLAGVGIIVILPTVIENIFAGIITLLLWPFLRKKKKDQNNKD